MKITRPLLVTTALLALAAQASANSYPSATGSTSCENEGFTPPSECPTGGCESEPATGESEANQSAAGECEDDENSPAISNAGGSGSGGANKSFVQNGRLELHQTSTDYTPPTTSPGCATCGDSASVGAGLASVRVKRHFQSRLTGNENSSFGRASALADYDVSLSWKSGHMLSVVNTYNEAASIIPVKQLNWHNDTQTYRPIQAARAAWGLALFDASGNPITAAANRDLAHTGVFLEANGKSTHFQFIRRADNQIFGRPVAFADRNGNLVTVSYVDPQPAYGTTVTTISEYFRRTKITDPYGRELLFEYQLHGDRYLVSKITHPDGEDTEYSYTTVSFYGRFISAVAHPDGTTSTAAWNRNNATGYWETEFYNATASPGDRVLKAFISTNSGVNDNGNTVATIVGLTRRVDNGAGEMTYANRLDAAGNRIIYEGGRSAFEIGISNATKGLNRQRVLEFDASPQADFFTCDLSTVTRTTTLTKANSNQFRETTRTDAFGRTTLSPARHPVTKTITRSEKPDGTATDIVLNAFDTPILVTDRLGRVTKREFDVKGNITKVTRGFGDPAASTTEYLYNAQGLVTEKRDPLYDPAYPDLHNTQYEYNANHYPVKIIHPADVHGGPAGDPPGAQANRPETLFTWDAAGRLATTTDPLGRTVSYTYDTRSRLVATTYADNSSDTLTYGTGTKANLVVERTDRNGIVTEYHYDAADRLTTTITAAGLPESITETCQYLPGTRLKSVCINRGEKTEYQYDARNRLVSTTRHADANTALTSTTEFDILGRRRSSTDPYGRRTFYLYDHNDRLTRAVTETVPNGLDAIAPVPAFSNTSSQTAQQTEREITLTNGEEITLRGIHTVTYTDARDLFLKNLTRDLSPNAPYLITDSLHDAEGQTLTTTDARGIETLHLRDVLGRTRRHFEAITLPEERLTETDYDAASNVIETRLPRHFAEVDANNDPVRTVETYTYTGRNLRKTHTVAAGHPTLEATQSWTYNLDGTVKTHTDFRGHANLTLWNTCCARLQAYIDRDGQSTRVQNTDRKGNPVHTATLSADPSSGGTAFTEWHDPAAIITLQESTTRFDGLDRPTHTTAWLAPIGSIAAACCGGSGQVPIATDPADGLTTTFLYDEDLTDGQGIDLTYAAQFVELAARGVTFNADANGFATAVTNPAGETHVTVQDGLGRTVMTINPEGHIQTLRHDEVLPVSLITPPHLADIPLPGDLLTTVATDPLGNQTITYTDGAGRTLLAEDAAGNLSGAAYDANSNVVITRDANGLGENCAYDALNRKTTCNDLQEQFELTARTFTYNAHNAVLTTIDAEGESTENTYDARDRLASTEDANNLVTEYGYDANNNLLTLTDPKNATRSWTYDERNLKVTKVMPDPNDSIAYTHDALRRIKMETRQDNSTVELTYDLAGRMTSRQYSDSTTDTFEYDPASRLVTATKGRHAITTTRSYHPDGTMASETQTLDGRAYTLERSYDAANRVATQTFADGKVMTWTHDSRHLVSEAHYDGKLVLEQGYDPGYRLTQQTFGNNLVREITFDRLDNQRTADRVKDGPSVIDELDFTYGYLADKNVETETQADGLFENLSFTAAYDAGNRVTSYNRQGSYVGTREAQSWNYDGAGNWNSTVIDGTTQNRTHSASDQLEVIAGDNLTYDPRGNLLSDERGNSYTWDLDNRIIESNGSGYTKIEYRYDALGRRIVRKQGTTKEVLLWWGNTEQSEHKHQAGQTTIQNDLQANPSEQALNTIFARALEGSKFDIEYFHKNYLDHVMAVSNDNGNLIEHYRYTAFGEPEIYDITGTRLTTTAIDNDILWNVRRYEPANGLYMYLYRDYDAASGRWPSRDPIEERGGINLYGFVGNDVMVKWDKWGLSSSGTRPYICCVVSLEVFYLGSTVDDFNAYHSFAMKAVYEPYGTIKKIKGTEYCCNPKRCNYSQGVKGFTKIDGVALPVKAGSGQVINETSYTDDGYSNDDDTAPADEIFYTEDHPGYHEETPETIQPGLMVDNYKKFRSLIKDDDGTIVAAKEGYWTKIYGVGPNYAMLHGGFSK